MNMSVQAAHMASVEETSARARDRESWPAELTVPAESRAEKAADARGSRLAAKAKRWVALVVLVSFVLAVLQGFVLARSCSAQEAPDHAAQVNAWVAKSAGPYLRSHAAQALPRLSAGEVGAIEPADAVATYSYEDGGMKASGIWVVPLRLEGSFVGTLAFRWEGGEGRDVVLTASDSFASAAAALPAGERILVAPKAVAGDDLGAFFLISGDSVVTPLDPNGRDVVAGPIPLSSFLDIIEARSSTTAPAVGGAAGSGTIASHLVSWVVAALLVIAAAVGITVWYRRDLMDDARLGAGEGEAQEAHRRRSWIHHRSEGAKRTGRSTDTVTIYDKPVRTPHAERSGSTGEASGGAGKDRQ